MWPLTVPEGVAAGALLTSMLHLVLSRWRDLGPLTVGLVGVSLGLALPEPSEGTLAAVVVAMVVSSAAWARGGTRGVGRPALTGLVVAASIAGPALVRLTEVRFGVDPERARWAAASCVALLTCLTSAMALSRARPGRPPVRWTGEIPVHSGQSHEQ